MFGIIDENKKFILLDSDHDKLRTTALMLVHEEAVTVTDYDEEGNEIGRHEEKQFVPMFTDETVDATIAEYADSDIEKAYTGEYYLAGFAPQPTEYEIAQARIAELKALLDSKDYWTSKRADGEYSEEEWAEKVATRKAWRAEINELEKVLTKTEESAIIE